MMTQSSESFSGSECEFAVEESSANEVDEFSMSDNFDSLNSKYDYENSINYMKSYIIQYLKDQGHIDKIVTAVTKNVLSNECLKPASFKANFDNDWLKINDTESYLKSITHVKNSCIEKHLSETFKKQLEHTIDECCKSYNDDIKELVENLFNTLKTILPDTTEESRNQSNSSFNIRNYFPINMHLEKIHQIDYMLLLNKMLDEKNNSDTQKILFCDKNDSLFSEGNNSTQESDSQTEIFLLDQDCETSCFPTSSIASNNNSSTKPGNQH